MVAVLNATNVGRGTGSTFTFRINNKAVIKSVTVGGATATFRSVPETYGNLHRMSVTLVNTVAAGGSVSPEYHLHFAGGKQFRLGGDFPDRFAVSAAFVLVSRAEYAVQRAWRRHRSGAFSC